MTTFRCLHCGHQQEVEIEPAGDKPTCPRCGQAMVASPVDREDATASLAIPSPPFSSPLSGEPVTGAYTLPGGTRAKLRQAETAPGAMHRVSVGGQETRAGADSVTDIPPSTPSLSDFLAPPQEPNELGRLGTYRVFKVIGSGGMGVVYEAEDLTLQRRVALKALLPTLATNPTARQRFLREARAAAAVEHDHIVPIYQVGEDRGLLFLAMPLLKGESLEDRLKRQPTLPLAEVLRIGREIALALAAAHEQGLVHRDIKPANIWLESKEDPRQPPTSEPVTPRVKVLDFGLARAFADTQTLTQQGYIIGTPAYMAPEQAGGQPVDARSDLFSLGCVLYRMCTGRMAFQGPDTISTLMAVATRHPEAPGEINPGVPAGLSSLIMQLLAKDPGERPPSAKAVVQTLDALLQPQGSGTEWVPGPQPRRRRRWPIPVMIAAAVLIGGGALLISQMNRHPKDGLAPATQPEAGLGQQVSPASVEIGVAFGTEKRSWLEGAVRAFAATPEGKNITVHLIPLGSLEANRAIGKEEDHRIHVWSPANSLYKDKLVREWQARHGGNLILKEAALVLTPMVFILWEERYQALVQKYQTVSFTTIAQALKEKEGWSTINKQPDWGSVKFGQTDAQKSNSGLMMLVLAAHEYHHTARPLTPREVADDGFRTWLQDLENSIPRTCTSNATMMEEMILRGPSSFDAVFTYENVAIDYLLTARGRWGGFHLVYPRYNLWNDNPYYILDVPWSNPEQRQAAETFLHFLMSEPVQKQALTHGFRPGDINIPIKDVPDSPFVMFQQSGLTINLTAICESPAEGTVDDLLLLWKKVREKK